MVKSEDEVRSWCVVDVDKDGKVRKARKETCRGLSLIRAVTVFTLSKAEDTLSSNWNKNGGLRCLKVSTLSDININWVGNVSG